MQSITFVIDLLENGMHFLFTQLIVLLLNVLSCIFLLRFLVRVSLYYHTPHTTHPSFGYPRAQNIMIMTDPIQSHFFSEQKCSVNIRVRIYCANHRFGFYNKSLHRACRLWRHALSTRVNASATCTRRRWDCCKQIETRYSIASTLVC